MFKVYVNLEGDVARALARLSYQESRNIRDQVTFLIKKELEWRGLLPSSNAPTQERETAHEM